MLPCEVEVMGGFCISESRFLGESLCWLFSVSPALTQFILIKHSYSLAHALQGFETTRPNIPSLPGPSCVIQDIWRRLHENSWTDSRACFKLFECREQNLSKQSHIFALNLIYLSYLEATHAPGFGLVSPHHLCRRRRPLPV